ncbi:MAG: HNH endonuclease [Carboxylicivirga sp.]|jgi:5-methylcytosine-specific restriction endonuclease McrA|nr:HNH endonuclease [Carboxylicivirga sp.]
MSSVCTYCGSSRNIQDDHIIAQSKGGVATTEACAACNQSKSDKPLMEWLRWVKENDSYRWNRIVDHNYRKKSTIAQKIQKIRDEN